MAAKKDKMIPSEKERKRALKYATPAGTGRMWVTMGIAFIIFGIILLLIPIGLVISEASAQRYDPESIHTATLVFYLLGAFFGFCGCFCVIFGKLAVKAFVALVEDFKELIDTTVKAGKDSYKHVDLFDGKSLEESVTHTVPLDDDKAQFLAAACMDLANSTLWLYHHNNQFQDTEFAEVVNNDYPKYQIQVQQEMNGEGERFYLRGWYPLVQKISRECQLKAYEGYKPKEQMTYVNIYLLVYAAMKSLKNGSLSRIMANIEHDSDKIGNLAFYFFTYILEVLEMPL